MYPLIGCDEKSASPLWYPPQNPKPNLITKKHQINVNLGTCHKIPCIILQKCQDHEKQGTIEGS